MSIRSDLIYLITECQTPKEIWDTSKKHSERVTIANNFWSKICPWIWKSLILLRRQLAKVEKLINCMTVIKASIPVEQHIVDLLLSLSRSYNTFVTALTAKRDELDLNQLHQAFLNKEEKRRLRRISTRDFKLWSIDELSRVFGAKTSCSGDGPEGTVVMCTLLGLVKYASLWQKYCTVCSQVSRKSN